MSDLLADARANLDGCALFGYPVTDPERYGIVDLIDLGRGFMWLDAGMHQSLLAAGGYLQILAERQGASASARCDGSVSALISMMYRP